MNSTRRVAHLIIALMLIIIGVCGLILPILNGVIFLLLGFILLSFESPYIEHHLKAFVHKNKNAEKWYSKLDAWMRKKFN